MVTSGRCFSCDSLRDNTKGSGKKLAYPKRHTVQGMINIQELSRSFARSIWQQAGGGVGGGMGVDISARLSHYSSSLSEKASKSLNI